jgi:hypothetical protein
MRNHFHLVVKTPLGNLKEFMRHFNISYTSYFNRGHKRVGHLYQGRYKAFLIDADSYLQEVTRYVHLNPIRVKGKANLDGLEKKRYLEGYRWSSYPLYLKRGKRNSFLNVGEVFCNGVGPWQVSDIGSNRVEMTPRNGPIVRFSRVKRLFFPRVYGESEAALYSRLHLAYHPSMP